MRGEAGAGLTTEKMTVLLRWESASLDIFLKSRAVWANWFLNISLHALHAEMRVLQRDIYPCGLMSVGR
jgi:hypothetical protein